MGFIRSIGNIKYYLLCMLAACGFYSYSGMQGRNIFGDDNLNKDKDGTAASGTRHAGGHGIYYHK